MRTAATVAPQPTPRCQIVLQFFQQCHQMKQQLVAVDADSAWATRPHAQLWSSTRALEICDAMLNSSSRASVGPAR